MLKHKTMKYNSNTILYKKHISRTSAFAKAGRVAMIPAQYTNSLWALATATIPEEVETHVTFIGGNKIVCVCHDGSLHLYQFSADGSINRVEVHRFSAKPFINM